MSCTLEIMYKTRPSDFSRPADHISSLQIPFRAYEADSYAYEKLIRKWTKSVFFFGTKNMSEGHLMHTVLVCYFFDKLGQACLCG